MKTLFRRLALLLGVALILPACHGSGSSAIVAVFSVTGAVSTLSGDGTGGFQESTIGTGANAQFFLPRGLTLVAGFLYVCDGDNYRIRRVDAATGETATLAGDGTNAHLDSTDGTGGTAQFTTPFVITYDDGFLYVGSDAHIRKVNISTGETTTLAGDGTMAFQDSTDGTGATAQFNVIIGLVSDGTFLYVGDAGNNRIRKVSLATGETTTLAGDGTAAFQDSTDGTGGTAQFSSPRGVDIHNGSIYVADGGNHRIRRVNLVTGNTTTLAGDGIQASTDSTDGTGATAQFNFPRGLTVIGKVLYLTTSTGHKVRRIAIPSGNTTTVAGSVAGFMEGTGAVARFDTPYGIAHDENNLYVSDQNNNRIRLIQ